MSLILIHNRNVDYVQFGDSVKSVPISVVNPKIDGEVVDHTKSLSNTQFDRNTSKPARRQ